MRAWNGFEMDRTCSIKKIVRGAGGGWCGRGWCTDPDAFSLSLSLFPSLSIRLLLLLFTCYILAASSIPGGGRPGTRRWQCSPGQRS